KFVGRNRILATAAGMVGAAVVIVIFAVAWRAIDLARERDRTAAALRVAEDINSFLAGTLEAADAGVADGKELTVRTILDSAAQRVRAELADRPSAAARIHLAIGRAYEGLGFPPEARREFGAATECLRTAPISPLLLADALEALGRSEVGAGEKEAARSHV